MIFSKSKIAGPPDVRVTVSKAVIAVDAPISLIIPVAPSAKSGSLPDTRKVVVAVGEHVEEPENAIQGGTVVTPIRDPVWLLFTSTPPLLKLRGVANTFEGVIAMRAAAK